MDNSKYFYFSGFIAISLFLSLFMLTVRMLFSPLNNHSFALHKDKFISISLVMPITHKQTKIKDIKSSSIAEKSPSKVQKVDINNLFSDVWTKKIVHKKETFKIENKRLIHELTKKIHKSEIKRVTPLSKSSQEQHSASVASEVNEYLAKIQAIVYQNFFVPHNSQGNSIKTVIELDAFGKVLDFRVLVYSQNQLLNEEADRIKERIKNVIFPKNPEKKATRTIVVLISKE